MTQQTIDPWDLAGTESVNTKEYYGAIVIDCVTMVFPGEKGSGQRPVAYDPAIHKGKQPFVQITATLDPLPEMMLSRETSCNWQNYSADWTKITMPSIRKLGFVTADGRCDLRKFNKSYVKFHFVPGFTKNRDPQKENYKTIEFLKVYKNAKECLADFQANNTDAAADPAPATTNDNAMALQFVQSVIDDARKNGKDVTAAVEDFLTKNAALCNGLTAKSPEVLDLLSDPAF